MMRCFALVALVLAPACGSSTPKPAAPIANTAPATAAAPTAARCHEMLLHRVDLAYEAANAAPDDQKAQRQAAIEQARAAGILGTPSGTCPTGWTNAQVDCVLAATTLPSADACEAHR